MEERIIGEPSTVTAKGKISIAFLPEAIRQSLEEGVGDEGILRMFECYSFNSAIF